MQNLSSLGEKLGVLIILCEKNNIELNELILSVDCINHEITLIINDIVDELRNPERRNTRTEIDENVKNAYNKHFSDALIRVQTPIDILLSYLENNIQDMKYKGRLSNLKNDNSREPNDPIN